MNDESRDAEIASLKVRIENLERQNVELYEMIDTLWTPFWKRIWYWLDGWPLYKLADHPAWRPWRRK